MCTYDHIVVTPSVLDEFAGTIDVFHFDDEYGLDVVLAEAVSDHYPVFAVFGAR